MKVHEFLKSQGYTEHKDDVIGGSIYHTFYYPQMTENGYLTIQIEIVHNKAYITKDFRLDKDFRDGIMCELFTDKELRFFDNIPNIELSNRHKVMTKQTLDDWF